MVGFSDRMWLSGSESMLWLDDHGAGFIVLGDGIYATTGVIAFLADDIGQPESELDNLVGVPVAKSFWMGGKLWVSLGDLLPADAAESIREAVESRLEVLNDGG